MSTTSNRHTAVFIGSATSTAVNLTGLKLVGLHAPAGLVGVSMTFLASIEESGTFRAITDDTGTDISITMTADRFVPITDSAKSLALAAAGWIKLVSSASETLSIEVEGTA